MNIRDKLLCNALHANHESDWSTYRNQCTCKNVKNKHPLKGNLTLLNRFWAMNNKKIVRLGKLLYMLALYLILTDNKLLTVEILQTVYVVIQRAKQSQSEESNWTW